MVLRGRPRYPDVLTPREWEVFHLLRQRHTNEEIADRLGITLDGAKYHVSSILSKLGVSSRMVALRWQPTQLRAELTPRRGWSFLLLAGKAASVAVAASAIVGVGVLGYGVIASRMADEPAQEAQAPEADGGEQPELANDERRATGQDGAPGESSATPTPAPGALTETAPGGHLSSVVAVAELTGADSEEGEEEEAQATAAGRVTTTGKPTPTPHEAEECDDCGAGPTRTPGVRPPQCCGGLEPEPTPVSTNEPDDTPEPSVLHETPAPTPTPTVTPSPPDIPADTEGPDDEPAAEPSVTAEPTETPEPAETPKGSQEPDHHDEAED
jgi:DNA-binding CsgD family transcriptional regulator